MLAFPSAPVQAGQTVTVFVERILGGAGVYTCATVIVVYSARKKVEYSVLFTKSGASVAVVGVLCNSDWMGMGVVESEGCAVVAGGGTLLEKPDDDEVMTAANELPSSKVIMVSGTPAGSGVLIGG